MDSRRISEALLNTQANDADLRKELQLRLYSASNEIAVVAASASDFIGLTPESIVLRFGRPMLAIRQNAVVIETQGAESKVWRQRLITASSLLQSSIRSVGRIEVQGHPNYRWLGTDWLVRPDILVTNRHVARKFTRRAGQKFQFEIGIGQRLMSADVDFLEEIDKTQSSAFDLSKVLHVEDKDGSDLAFFRVTGSGLAGPILLSEHKAPPSDLIAAVGYPARDSRVPDQDLMERLYANVYDKKRIAPGKVVDEANSLLRHDRPTLGGSSGSVLMDFKTGEAVGIYFAGRFLESNYALSSDRLAERLNGLERGASRQSFTDLKITDQTELNTTGDTSISFTVPLHMTVRLGDVVTSSRVTSPSVPNAALTPSQGDARRTDEGSELLTEGRHEDYDGSQGYQSRFLGHDFAVEMPQVVQDSKAILDFPTEGNAKETVLRYQNYSVVMNKARRMCFLREIKVDGNLSRRTKRTNSLLDSCISRNYQIIGECYGNPPKFTRSHMTRRENPAWGSRDEAHFGNADSMHITNAVPQMKSFNAGIWLGLEDYALENGRADDMKICVITSPLLYTETLYATEEKSHYSSGK